MLLEMTGNSHRPASVSRTPEALDAEEKLPQASPAKQPQQHKKRRSEHTFKQSVLAPQEAP